MTDVPPGSPVQLRYCPVCHQLIRPSMIQANEAVLQDGVFHHAACVNRPVRPASQRGVSARPVEPGAVAAHGDSGRVVTESVLTRMHPAPGHGGAAAHSPSGRRRSTGANVNLAERPSEVTPAARRSGANLRSHKPGTRGSGGATVLIGIVVGFGLVAAVAVAYMLNRAPEEPPVDSPVTANPRPGSGSGPGVTRPPQPPQPPANVPTNPPHNTPAATPTLTPTPTPKEPELTPYELAQRQKLLEPPVTPGINYEPAGAVESWFAGNTLGDWKLVKANAGAVVCRDGVVEFKPGNAVVVMEHALPMPDFDLSYEFRLGPGETGPYGELWLPSGVVCMDAAQFQSANWTPVKVSVRGGKIVANNGHKGPNDLHPSNVNTKPAGGERLRYMGGRQVVMLTVSRESPKSVRNFQYTPMRAVAEVVAPPPPPPKPTPVLDPAGEPTMVAQPVTIPADKIQQAQGKWERAAVETEAGKSFIVWSHAISTTKTLDFVFLGGNRKLPKKVHVRIVYRVRNTQADLLTVRFYSWNTEPATARPPIPAVEQWQTVEMDIDGCPATVDQLEIRLPSKVAADAKLDIAEVILSTPAAAP